MIIDYLNIPTKRKSIWTAFILVSLALNSCSVIKSKKNVQFERLMEEQLGIKKILSGKDTSYSRVKLVKGDKVRLNHGYNVIPDPSSGDNQKVFVKIKDGKVHKIEKVDILATENRIMREQWIIEKNGGELNFTTTDLEGKLIHFYGQVFSPGRRSADYTSTSVDSLGNSFTEWGTTGEAGAIRKKQE